MATFKEEIKKLIGLSLNKFHRDEYLPIEEQLNNASITNLSLDMTEVNQAKGHHATLKDAVESLDISNTTIKLTSSEQILTNSYKGTLDVIIVKGNTYQNPNTLEITSVGYKESGLESFTLCYNTSNANLFYGDTTPNTSIDSLGDIYELNDWVLSDYIRIHEGVPHYTNLTNYKVAYYDIQKHFLGLYNDLSTSHANASYIRITYPLSDVKPFLSEVNTSYVDRLTSEKKIYLPIELDKIGDISDRLFYQDIDKRWMIEHRIDTTILKSINISSIEVLDEHHALIHFTGATRLNTDNIISTINTYSPQRTKSEILNSKAKGIFVNTDKDTLSMLITKNELSEFTIEKAKEYIDSTEPIKVKYVRASPRYIDIQLYNNQALSVTSFDHITWIGCLHGSNPSEIHYKYNSSVNHQLESNKRYYTGLKDELDNLNNLITTQSVVSYTSKGELITIQDTGTSYLNHYTIKGDTKLIDNTFSYVKGDDLTVTTIGRNLFDTYYTVVEGGLLSTNIIKTRPNEYMTIQRLDGSKPIEITYYKDSTILETQLLPHNSTFKTPLECNGIRFKLLNTTLSHVSCMVEFGSLQSPYEPYTSNTKSILGSVDKLLKMDDNTFDYVITNGDVVHTKVLELLEIKDITNISISGDTFSIIVNNIKSNSKLKISDSRCSMIQNNSTLLFNVEGITTLEELRVYLISNPISIIYELTKPIINEYYNNAKLRTYQGVTTIFIESSNLIPSIVFDYHPNINITLDLLDAKISKLIDKLQKKLISNEGGVK